MSEKLELEVKPEVLTKEVEKELMANKKIEEKTVENSLNYAMLAPEEQKAIDEFVEKVNVEDTTQILQYGASAQTKISKFSDSVLENVKTKNAGEVGDLLSSLVVEIKDFDTSVGGEKPKGIFGIFHSAKNSVEKLLAKYQKIEVNVDKIEKNWYTLSELEKERYKYIMMLDLEEERLSEFCRGDEVMEEFRKEVKRINKDERYSFFLSEEEDAEKLRKTEELIRKRKEEKREQKRKLQEQKIEELEKQKNEMQKQKNFLLNNSVKKLIELNVDVNDISKTLDIPVSKVEYIAKNTRRN